MSVLLAALLLVPCATDATVLKEMLDLAAAGPTDQLRDRLESMAKTIQDADLRGKTQAALEDLTAAAALHARVAALVKEVADLGARATLEAGGPAWMRDLVGTESMKVFDRLVGISLYLNVNAHAKDYKLNAKIGDDWVDRIAGLPHLRSVDLENTNVKGPGLKAVGTLKTVESINLTLCPVTDEPLAALTELSKLRVLGLASTQVTGTGMKYLQELKKIENLNLHYTPVNDAGLEWIGKLASLTRLEIVHTQFTDAGARSLAGLVGLERLQLGSRKATGAALAALRELPKLRELDVHDGMMTPEGVRHVAGLENLRVLRVYGGGAGDDGLRALAGLKQLEILILEGVSATDAGVDALAGLTRLRKVTIHESKVSDAALARLRVALPAADIAR